MAIEYRIIQVLAGKVVKIEPSDSSTHHDDLEDFDVVMNRIRNVGWESTNPQYRPGTSMSLVRIQREAEYVEPSIPITHRITREEIPAQPDGLDDRIADVRHKYEVNGWDLVKIWKRNGKVDLFFSKPKTAPEGPFRDPNAQGKVG